MLNCLEKRTNTKTAGIFPYIINLICMRLSEKESLNYLKDKGFEISRAGQIKKKSIVGNDKSLPFTH